jgi:hypothetical protein
MSWTSLLVGSMLAIYAGRTHAICENTPPVWRNNNITCPDRAICADVFKTPRDWYNGTRCDEERILHHCLCNGVTPCPFNNPDHLTYASAQHLQYTCRPTCALPYCGNLTPRPSEGRSTPTVAQTLEQNSPDFGGRNYYRMNCRCPRHKVPYTRTPGVHRSVHAHSHIYDYRQHRYSTQFVCTTRENENLMPDPCGATNVVLPQ